MDRDLRFALDPAGRGLSPAERLVVIDLTDRLSGLFPHPVAAALAEMGFPEYERARPDVIEAMVWALQNWRHIKAAREAGTPPYGNTGVIA